jgi:hypothetical protein
VVGKPSGNGGIEILTGFSCDFTGKILENHNFTRKMMTSWDFTRMVFKDFAKTITDVENLW